MKVYLRTFGCRANQYDSEQVRALIEQSGGTIVEDPADADTAVFNSCAVTSEAEVELRKSIRGAARANASLRTVVMGCAAALDRGQLAAMPGGFAEKPEENAIVDFLRSRDGLELNKAFVRISDAKARRAIVDLVRSLANDDTKESP